MYDLSDKPKVDHEPIDEDSEMNLLDAVGADAVPEPENQNQIRKKFRLVTIGKMQLP